MDELVAETLEATSLDFEWFVKDRLDIDIDGINLHRGYVFTC